VPLASLAALALLLAPAAAQGPTAPPPALPEAPAAWKREPGPSEVASFRETWRDEARQRDLPVKVWHPSADGPFPVIVFSHGLGGTRDGYAYLGQHWASHGYVSVHLQHAGSDDAVWRGSSKPLEALQAAALDPENLLGRPRDVTFAVDELERRNARDGWPLAGELDLGALAVAGHSFGAYTALCAAGRDLVGPLGERVDLGDPRVKACLAMSPQGSQRDRANGSWKEVVVPCFHMTGTEDTSPIRGDATPAERRIPFDAIGGADQYLLILAGGDHMAFSDAGSGGRRDPADWPLVRSGSTAFFDAYLRRDERALAWLRDGGFARLVGSDGTFEHKRAAAK
jgi:predicted dienelactone hydrolase